MLITRSLAAPAGSQSPQQSPVAAGRVATDDAGVSLNLEPAAPEAADPKRWRALAVTQVAGFMTLLDVSIVNVALPSIQRDLGASAGTVQWVVSGYALAFGLALVPAGRLGDTLGRRRMFLIALSAFVVTSALSGAAPTAWLLIGARLLQGVAGGMLTPQNSGLIQDLFRAASAGYGVVAAGVPRPDGSSASGACGSCGSRPGSRGGCWRCGSPTPTRYGSAS